MLALPAPTVYLSSLAIILSFLSFSINLYMLSQIFCLKRIERKSELSLIYARFVVDLVHSVAIAANMSDVVIYLTSPIYPNFEHMNIVKFVIAWPNYSLASLRAALVFFITIDRVFAAYFPIRYLIHRNRISNWLIFGVVFGYVVLETLYLFLVCQFNFEISVECFGFGCAVNTCYRDHWLISEQVLYFVIILLAILLSVRLIKWSCSKKEGLSRVNRIALLDVIVIFFFDFLPAFVYSHFPQFTFNTIGPVVSLTKVSVFVLEAAVIYSILATRMFSSKINRNTPIASKLF